MYIYGCSLDIPWLLSTAFFCYRTRRYIILRYNSSFLPCQLSCGKGCLLFAMHSASLLFSYIKNKYKISEGTHDHGWSSSDPPPGLSASSHKAEGPGFAGEALLGKRTPMFHALIPFKSGLLPGSCIHIYLDASSNHQPLGFSVDAQAQKTLKLVRKLGKS